MKVLRLGPFRAVVMKKLARGLLIRVRACRERQSMRPIGPLFGSTAGIVVHEERNQQTTRKGFRQVRAVSRHNTLRPVFVDYVGGSPSYKERYLPARCSGSAATRAKWTGSPPVNVAMGLLL